VPLLLQDRWFNETNGQLEYNRFKEHEMYANYSMVNGMFSPYLSVLPTRYRFRLLNGCNTRTLILSLQVDHEGESDTDCSSGDNRNNAGEDMELPREKVSVTVVATDGGLIAQPAVVDEWMMVIAERMEIGTTHAQNKGGLDSAVR
jgi:FtsP/CotA-like multicopper oxidase with cupredoxin domain